MLLQQPALAASVDEEAVADLIQAQQPMLKLLVDVLEIARDRPNINPARLPEEVADAQSGERLAIIATLDLEQPEELREHEFHAAVAGLRKGIVLQRIEALQRQGIGHLDPAERELLRDLYERSRQLAQGRRSRD